MSTFNEHSLANVALDMKRCRALMEELAYIKL